MKKYLTIFYTLICLLGPIAKNYRSGIPSFTLLDVLIFVFYLISLPSLASKKKGEVAIPCVALFCYVFFHSVICLFISADTRVFMRAMRLLNYIFFIAFYCNFFFNTEFAQKAIRWLGVISTIFLIIQHISSMFLGFYIPGIIEAYAMNDDLHAGTVAGTEISRFSSFFAEPAGYATYITLILAHELFYQNKTNMKIVALLCLGAILSTSNSALATTGFLMTFYFIKNKIFNYKTFLFIFTFLAIAIVAQPYIEAISIRIEEGRSFSGRFSGYSYIDHVLTNPLWGMGFISPDDMDAYMPGYARLFIYFGYIGLFVYAMVFLNIFMNTSKKILVLVLLFLNVGASTFLSSGFIYYMCFIIAAKVQKKYGKSIYRNRMLQQPRRVGAYT